MTQTTLGATSRTALQPVLLSVPGATEGTTQWRVETLQVVNWGGFHGHTRVGLDLSSTLLSGASATGKSTLLDAYLALLMPADTPFNNASNDVTTGRARGADQRNLLSYLRGKRNSSRETGTDELTDQVLRGGDGATWGAVAATFVDDRRRRFTALRVYLVPRSATHTGDIVMKLATLDGRIDLPELAPLAPNRFDKRALQGRWPAMTVHGSYTEFSQTLFTRLGIGAGGDGRRALRLLSRIQGGHQFDSVDRLYKSLVLEDPPTYAAADNAIKHFADLDATYQAMVTEAAKAEVLHRLPDLERDLEQARADEHLLATLGLALPGDSPILLWTLRTEARLHNTAITASRDRRQHVHARHVADTERVEELEERLEEVREQKSDHGGDILERLRTELADLAKKRVKVAGRRSVFDDRIACLPVAPTSRAEFDAAHTAAEVFLADVPDRRAELEQRRDAVIRAGVPLTERREEVVAEHASLQGRAGLVPRHLHEARVAMAAAAGIDPDELPFVAELIDLDPTEHDWRPAAEAVLHSLVRIMLVDQRLLEQLSTRIDPLRLRLRVQFEGVPLAPFHPSPSDPAYLSGKLQHKDSPFSDWVQQRLRRRGTDARCVDTVDQLRSDWQHDNQQRGEELRVLRSGQTRHGRRGAHGNQSSTPIIGFSNTTRLAEIADEIAHLDGEIGELVAADKALIKQGTQLSNQEAAHRHLSDTAWDDIDLAAVDEQIHDRRVQHDRLLHSSDILRELQAQEDRLDEDLKQARETEFGARRDVEALDATVQDLTRRRSEITTALDRIDRDGEVRLTDAQTQRLDRVLTDVGDPDDLGGFTSAVKRLRTQLAGQYRAANERAAAAIEAQCEIFRNYQARWTDPNLGEQIASASGYRDILDRITATGLHERRVEWRRRLSDWSGQDLVPLNGAFETAIEDIEERLDPVNAILADLPFGPAGDHLHIALRRLTVEDLTTFRRELKELSSGITDDLAEEKMQARFERLRAFIDQIRPPRSHPRDRQEHRDERGDRPIAPRRDFFLDVRRHVQIRAVQLNAAGVEVAVHTTLGGKSGGESQELIAFIVGAALRFQLGDEDRARPRFAPVVLDEGFIKADSQYAGRAVAAWQGLGFQLIIAAPLDKVTALEPYMPLILTTTKSPGGYSHISEVARISHPNGPTDRNDVSTGVRGGPDTPHDAHDGGPW